MPLIYRYAIAAVVVVLDQISKVWVDRNIRLYEQIEYTSFFNLTKAYNSGAAFSFLSDAGGWQRWFFIGISVVVSIVLVVWLARMTRADKWLAVSVSLILGGAIGNNLIDRVLYGHVVDFLQVHWKSEAYFPSFNVADAAISCGAVILLILTFFEKPAPETDNAS